MAAATPTEPAAQPTAPAPRAALAHAVLSTGKRTFVLGGKAADTGARAEREILPGGFVLDIVHAGTAPKKTFTLVGPEGRCSARAKRTVQVGVDYGGYAGASLPGPKHSGWEIEGCESLAHERSFLIALDGDDARAEWVHPAHVDESPAPADRRLGESEVWLHRWALPDADLEIVERNVLRFVGKSCSEQRRDVLVVDELSHPVAQHQGFTLRGAVRTSTETLLVLLGHDEPEALRVVALEPADTRVALDTRIELFQDVERGEC